MKTAALLRLALLPAMVAACSGAADPVARRGDAGTGAGAVTAAADVGSVAARVPAPSPSLKTSPSAPATAPTDTACSDSTAPGFDLDRCGDPEAPVTPFAGEWQVTGVEPLGDGFLSYRRDDPAAVGSRFRITREKIVWTRSVDPSSDTNDVCTLPSAARATDYVAKTEGSWLRRAAAARGFTGPMMRFGCLDGGRWGPSTQSGGMALFIDTGPGRMVLQWYDGAHLIAERR